MKPIKSMRELELAKQAVNYKILHLEDKIKDGSKKALSSGISELKHVAFETGMRIILKLFFNHRKQESSND